MKPAYRRKRIALGKHVKSSNRIGLTWRTMTYSLSLEETCTLWFLFPKKNGCQYNVMYQTITPITLVPNLGISYTQISFPKFVVPGITSGTSLSSAYSANRLAIEVLYVLKNDVMWVFSIDSKQMFLCRQIVIQKERRPVRQHFFNIIHVYLQKVRRSTKSGEHVLPRRK